MGSVAQSSYQPQNYAGFDQEFDSLLVIEEELDDIQIKEEEKKEEPIYQEE